MKCLNSRFLPYSFGYASVALAGMWGGRRNDKERPIKKN
jgi:hypothetical protein